MGFSTVVTYDNANHFSFDTDLLEVSGGVLRLKDLGGGTYSTANPSAETQHQIMASSLSALAETKSAAGSDQVKYQLLINDVAHYYDTSTSTWEQASGANYSEANTAAEISAALADLTTQLSLIGSFYVRLRVFFHSASGTTRPSLTNNTFTYAMLYGSPPTISECLIYAYLSDLLGADYVHDSSRPATLHVKNDRPFFHGSKLIRPFRKSAAFNSSGYVELSVIETETPGEYLELFVTYYEGSSMKSLLFLPCLIPNAPTRPLNQIAPLRDMDVG